MDAPRTLREQLNRRFRWPRWLWIVPIISFAIAIIASTVAHIEPFVRFVLLTGSLVLLITGTAFGVWMIGRVSCPKCDSSLGAFVFGIMNRSNLKKIKFCPYCAVNLDDPLPKAPQPQPTEKDTPAKLAWK
jgi:hypothetical protein